MLCGPGRSGRPYLNPSHFDGKKDFCLNRMHVFRHILILSVLRIVPAFDEHFDDPNDALKINISTAAFSI